MVTATGNLQYFLDPRSVAIIGASTNPSNPGGRVLKYFKRSFGGAVYPVNARNSVVQDLPAFPSILEVPESPDLVIVAVPAEHAVGAVRDCARRGVKAVTVFTAGFAEASEEGRRQQDELARIARESGMRITGPNSLGYINVSAGVYGTFTTAAEHTPPGGPIAIVAQSGGFGSMLFSVGLQIGLGVGFLCSTGNECDVNVPELIEHMVERRDVHVILAFSEGIRDPEALLRAAVKARELGKAIVYCKAGRSEVGARAALSHSAAVVGSDEVVDAVFEQYGILRANGMDDLLDWARVLSCSSPPRGNRVALVTASGGGGVLVADTAAELGLEMPAFAGEERARISAILPEFGSAANPVDLTAQVQSNPDLFGEVLRTVAESASVDILTIFLGALDPIADELIERIDHVRNQVDKPIVTMWGGGSKRYKTALNERGVPTYDDHVRALRAVSALVRAHTGNKRTAEVEVVVDKQRQSTAASLLGEADGRVLREDAGKQLLALYGLPVTRHEPVGSVDEAAVAASRIGYPVAIKVLSADLAHLSDVGGLRLALQDEAALRRAFVEMLEEVARRAPRARVERVLVESMAEPGIELICGMKRDSSFGPMVTVGLGGVMVEILGEVQLRRAPLTHEEALEALRALCSGRLTKSSRGLDPLAQQQVADLLVRLGQLAVEQPDVTEVDCNPVIVGRRPTVVDALVVKDA